MPHRKVGFGPRSIGHAVVDGVGRLGFASRFFLMTLISSGASFRRIHLMIREIYFSGVMSLIIILVSGLFVGMVLGLQGYETLQKYGSESALGSLVALSLVRELGPVLAALLFASRAGSAITAEIGLMKATEQLSAMEMMAVDPISRVVAPRFWAGVISSTSWEVSLISASGAISAAPATAVAQKNAVTRNRVWQIDFFITHSKTIIVLRLFCRRLGLYFCRHPHQPPC